MLTNEAVICLYKLWEVWPLQYKQFNLKEAIFINLSLLLLALLKTVSTDNRWLRCVGLLILLLAGFKNMSRRKKTCISWISPTPLHQCQKEREKKSFSSCVNNKELFKARHPGNKEKKKKKGTALRHTQQCWKLLTSTFGLWVQNMWIMIPPSLETAANLCEMSVCVSTHTFECAGIQSPPPQPTSPLPTPGCCPPVTGSATVSVHRVAVCVPGPRAKAH